MMDEINDRLRKLVESGDNTQGFIMNHSIGGGTGSGLASLILEKLNIDYNKKIRMNLPIFSFGNLHSNNYIEIYNALLSIYWLLDYSDLYHWFMIIVSYIICVLINCVSNNQIIPTSIVLLQK